LRIPEIGNQMIKVMGQAQFYELSVSTLSVSTRSWYDSRGETNMTTIAILPENPGTQGTRFRAIAGQKQSVGRTAGEALDALTPQLDESQAGTLVVVQQLHPDHFFSAEQQKRLEALMARWRQGRDTNTSLPPTEQAELDALVEAELRAAADRATAMVRRLAP
jgi:hypothetical protein